VLVTDPPNSVSTVIFPVLAPAGTVTVICVEVALNDPVGALTPSNLTALKPWKFCPVITKTFPTLPIFVSTLFPLTLKSVILGLATI